MDNGKKPFSTPISPNRSDGMRALSTITEDDQVLENSKESLF